MPKISKQKYIIMLQFNELRVDSDKNLIIDASVLDITEDPNNTIGIESLKIGFGTNTELEEFLTLENIQSGMFDRIDRESADSPIRGFRLVLDLNVYEATTKMMYVRIEADVPSEILVNLSCLISTVIDGYAYDRCLLVSKVLDYIGQSVNMCEDIDNYANYIAQVEGLELAIKTGDFTVANNYWNRFFANTNVGGSLTSNCGCRCH